MKINENIAYAKSILNKSGVTQESPEYQDYLKIREIVGNDNGYVGILTKLRFIDNVTDMEEIKSIYEILKKQKFDFAKLNKLTYDQILELFYDDLSSEKTKNEDIELIFRDEQYSYYRVYTYKGILKIGSPTWCLKTKSNWDRYQATYPEQWVVVDNRYKNKLITPEDDLIKNYVSNKGWIRYGISIKTNPDATVTWVANDDNNRLATFDPVSYTFFGVMCTVLNLNVGIKKSYHERFFGCTRYADDSAWHKVVNIDKFVSRVNVNPEHLNRFKESYVAFSKSYSSYIIMLCFDDSMPRGLWVHKKYPEDYADLCGTTSMKIVEDYASRSDNEIWYGVNLKTGKITLDDVKKDKDFMTIIDDKWGLFNRNDNYYVLVNLKPKSYEIPAQSLGQSELSYKMKDPLFWYLEKQTAKAHKVNFEGMQDIIHKVYEFEKKKNSKMDDVDVFDTPETPEVENPKVETPEEKKPEETEKKVKGFWDFFRRK